MSEHIGTSNLYNSMYKVNSRVGVSDDVMDTFRLFATAMEEEEEVRDSAPNTDASSGKDPYARDSMGSMGTIRGPEAKRILDMCTYAGFGTFIDPREDGLAWTIVSEGDDELVICRHEDEVGRVIRRHNNKKG